MEGKSDGLVDEKLTISGTDEGFCKGKISVFFCKGSKRREGWLLLATVFACTNWRLIFLV